MEIEQPPRVENGTDVILVLLYAGGKIEAENEKIIGNTRLDKLIFLLDKETSFCKYLKEFEFLPYNFGPYSSEVFDSLQALANAHLVKVSTRVGDYLDEADRFQVELQAGDDSESPKATVVYSLTAEGKKVARILFDNLAKQERDELILIKKKYNAISLRDLLKYVYGRYPRLTTKSVIKDYVY
nr:hypothetical protein [Candidatus Njordarchaeota archaeon]